MADSDRTRIEYVGGDSVDVQAAMSVVESNLIAAKAGGTFCHFVNAVGSDEIAVNPEAVRALKPSPGGRSASF